jgi:hypothetical protein
VTVRRKKPESRISSITNGRYSQPKRSGALASPPPLKLTRVTVRRKKALESRSLRMATLPSRSSP